MSDPDDAVPSAPAPPDLPPDRAPMPGPQPEQSGSSFGAVILFILSFMSLLSTGCFGVFAIGINESGTLIFFGTGALVMACVTLGLFLWARALQRSAKSK